MSPRDARHEAAGDLVPQARGAADAAANLPIARRMPGAEWVVRAQDGQAAVVLAEIDVALAGGLQPRAQVQALYAKALALHMLSDFAAAVEVSRQLCTLCREESFVAHGVRARALLADLLRRDGQLEEAIDELARAVALEPKLDDLHDPDVQAALGALAVALRLSGVAEEAARVDERLQVVEHTLSRSRRVARWSNRALGHAVQGMAAGRVAPHRPDVALLQLAVSEIGRAAHLAGHGHYDVVEAEESVVGALLESVDGSGHEALRRLERCRHVLDRGAEAVGAQLLWGTAMVRALVRTGRRDEAVEAGRQVLSSVAGEERDRLVLAYEVMRAEQPGSEEPGSGAATFVQLAGERLGQDLTLVNALFRARVDLLRGDEQRRVLARAASLDPLTGLVNRRGAADAIREAARRPDHESVALLLVDLDGFKEVNDTEGHLAGDLVLQRVAAALRTAARLEDVVARWGGDEFVVVAQLDAERAVALADRLREAIRTRTQAEAGVTASIGVAVRVTAVDQHRWLHYADAAMYRAKRQGGDATVMA